MKYRYKPDGHRELGPVDEAALRKLVQAGRVNALTAVRLQRGTEWFTAGRLLPDLFAQPEGSAVASTSVPWGRWELERTAPMPKTEWKNSLGMKFLPVPGTDVLFSVWATRVQDYAAYAVANCGVDAGWKSPVYADVPVATRPTHPVVNVSWDDAQEFVKWLTAKERSEGLLPAGATYRLPADWEWSVAVGLNEALSGTPKDKHMKIEDVYPWGTQWPPPPGAGNFGDTSLKARIPCLEVIEGYTDGYATTSPVGSFAVNKHGLYDLSGNVFEWCKDVEWCEDFYDGERPRCVLRGGAWCSIDHIYLLSSYRLAVPPDQRGTHFGFRVVLCGSAGLLVV